jgi:hypothetical protein
MPVHCQRCWQEFESQQQLDSHIKVAAVDICELTAGHPPEGISSETEKLLRRRKKSYAGQSEEERWKDIYRLLFPNDEDVPSPCKLFGRYRFEKPRECLNWDARNSRRQK